MPTIKVQSIPKKKVRTEDILALFCYHFSQYKFHQAEKLPYRRVIQMLRVAEKEHAKKMFELTQIAAAPHTAKMKGVRQLAKHYESIIKE